MIDKTVRASWLKIPGSLRLLAKLATIRREVRSVWQQIRARRPAACTVAEDDVLRLGNVGQTNNLRDVREPAHHHCGCTMKLLAIKDTSMGGGDGGDEEEWSSILRRENSKHRGTRQQAARICARRISRFLDD